MGCAAVAVEMPALVTRGTTNASAAGHSLVCSMTPDAKFVVFSSHANNLVLDDDANTYADIFVRDLSNGIVTLVTKAIAGVGGGDGHSGYASISRDGRYVVFASDAGNLVANDTNDVSDVFRYDLQGGTNKLVSVALSGGVAAASRPAVQPGASRPVMSPDGRFVAFEGNSTELVAGDTNATRKVFLRDVQNGVTILASGDARECSSAALSANAKQIAFICASAGAITQANSSASILVRDLETGATHWANASVGSMLPASNGYRCLAPTIAPDGSFVVFKVLLPGASLSHVIKYDFASRQAFLLGSNSHPGTSPGLSADGQWLGFDESGNIYVRDLRHETNLLVSVNTSGTNANGQSHAPVLTSDGRHVAFLSAATDLTTDSYPATPNLCRIYVRDIVAGVTRLATRATNDLPEIVSGAAQPFVSDDGKTVVFDTDSPTLVPQDNNAAYDVFARNVEASVTTLVSAGQPNRTAQTGIQSGKAWWNSLSANGQRIAFTMLDDPAGAADTNGEFRVVVADVPGGAAFVQDIPPESTPFRFRWRWPSNLALSGDGTHVLVETSYPIWSTGTSDSRFLFWGRVEGASTVQVTAFTRDAGDVETDWKAAMNSNGTLVVVAGRLYDMVAQTNWSLPFEFRRVRRPIFSPDEKWVVARNSADDVYAVQLESNRVVHVSKDANGGSLASSFVGVFDGSGNYYTFDSHPDEINSLRRRIFRYDFSRDATDLVCTNCASPSVDRTGNVTAFVSQEESAASRNIYVIEGDIGRTELITINLSGTGAANGESKLATISADGRYVVFVSRASDLVSSDNNNADDIFVRDRLYKTTHLLSRSRHGGSGNALSSMPLMAQDGRTIVFQSFASDVVEGDYNDERDIFVVKLGMGDSDNDGMDDDWEVAHFGNLDRDGAGDQDGDGQSDLQEFLAGTNPTNGGSILRVLTITPIGGGSTTLVWSAVVGRNYVVQYKDSLDGNWGNASGVIEADSASMSFAHNSSSSQRYYRVIAVQ